MSYLFFKFPNKRNVFIFIVLLIFICCFVWFEENFYFWSKNFGFLENYIWTEGPVKIANGAEQSSGLAFNESRKELYVIVNSPPEIEVLSPSGQFIREIKLIGFEDTEGITYLGGEFFAVVSERLGTISWFRLSKNDKVVYKYNTHSVELYKNALGNTGLEGVTYAKNIRQLIIVKERKPKEIVAVNWPIEEISHPMRNLLWDAERSPWGAIRNFSGIYYHPPNHHLFILSRRSKSITEYTLSGKKVGYFSLKNGSANLNLAIEKAEGIVMSEDGTLYICGEPNQLFIFKQKV